MEPKKKLMDGIRSKKTKLQHSTYPGNKYLEPISNSTSAKTKAEHTRNEYQNLVAPPQERIDNQLLKKKNIPSSLEHRLNKSNQFEAETKKKDIFNKRKKNRLKGFVASAFLSLIIVFFVLNYFHRATIHIVPFRKYLSVTDLIKAERNAQSHELEFSIIAVTKKASRELSTDTISTVSKYATGQVKLYNNYSSEPERLIPGTRLRSLDGLEFIIEDKEIVIPGMEGTIPGELVVSVYSEFPRSEYNISPTDFSIPSFIENGLTEKYEQIYGISIEPFSSGGEDQIPGISQTIRDQEVNNLKNELKNILQDSLVVEKTPSLILIQKTPVIEFDEAVFEYKENNKGTLSLSGTIYAVLLDKREFSSYLSQKYLNLDEHVTVKFFNSVTPVLIADNRTNKNFDIKNSNDISFTIANPLLFEWSIEEEKMKNSFKNLSKEKMVEHFQTLSWLGKVTIRINPVWKKTVPSTIQSIQISIDN